MKLPAFLRRKPKDAGGVVVPFARFITCPPFFSCCSYCTIERLKLALNSMPDKTGNIDCSRCGRKYSFVKDDPADKQDND